MIQISEEPKKLFDMFRTYEKCKFCGKDSKTWHLPSNTPVCEICSKTHDDSQL